MQINGDVIVSKTYINQSTLSSKLGWSEATGRKWITEFQEFVPPKMVGKSKMYDDNAYKVLVTIKQLSDKKFTRGKILEIFKEEGVPETVDEVEKIIKEYSVLDELGQALVDSIPSLKDLIIPLLNVMRDRKPFIASMLNKGVAEYLL